MADLDIRNIKFKLIYLDPPFYTQTNFKHFTDIWSSFQQYLLSLYPVFLYAKRLLTDDGALFVHCDWHGSHYIKTILDEIFENDNFGCEIFTKRSAKNAVNVTRRLFANVDSLFLYWKSSEGRILELPKKPVKKGERWATLTAGGSGPPMEFFNKLIYPPKGRHWMWSQERINEESKKGNIKLNSKGNPYYRITRDWLPVGTLWNDIPSYSTKFGYSTEKSEELMRRIMIMCSAKDDNVGDFYCGSAPMLKVCLMAQRNYYGCDINSNAVKIAKLRIVDFIKKEEIDKDIFEF